MKPSVASLYQAVEIAQDIPPLLIGERSNTNGSKKFRECLLADDFDGCLRIGLEQETQGAQVLDLCSAYAGRDETADLTQLVKLYAESVKIPIMIDSTTPDCIEACLKLYPGRCIINSINLEDGGKTLDRVCRLAKKYGAAVVALTINVEGMAMTADEKVETARQIYQQAVANTACDPRTFSLIRSPSPSVLVMRACLMPGIQTLGGYPAHQTGAAGCLYCAWLEQHLLWITTGVAQDSQLGIFARSG